MCARKPVCAMSGRTISGTLVHHIHLSHCEHYLYFHSCSIRNRIVTGFNLYRDATCRVMRRPGSSPQRLAEPELEAERRGTEAVTAAESGLLSAVQMAFADSQSAVAGSATVTSPAPSSGSTVMRHSRFGSMPFASWCGLSTRRAPVTHPPVTANARSRMVRYRRDRFDYLLGAGNGDSPSSFRNALCFAVDS